MGAGHLIDWQMQGGSNFAGSWSIFPVTHGTLELPQCQKHPKPPKDLWSSLVSSASRPLPANLPAPPRSERPETRPGRPDAHAEGRSQAAEGPQELHQDVHVGPSRLRFFPSPEEDDGGDRGPKARNPIPLSAPLHPVSSKKRKPPSLHLHVTLEHAEHAGVWIFFPPPAPAAQTRATTPVPSAVKKGSLAPKCPKTRPQGHFGGPRRRISWEIRLDDGDEGFA